jgi:hypothetical protein
MMSSVIYSVKLAINFAQYVYQCCVAGAASFGWSRIRRRNAMRLNAAQIHILYLCPLKFSWSGMRCIIGDNHENIPVYESMTEA